LKNRRGILIAIAVLLISITAVSTLHVYLEIYAFYITIKEKVLALKQVERICRNVNYVQLDILSEIFVKQMELASKKCFSRREVEKRINVAYNALLRDAWSSSELKSYFTVKNKTVTFFTSNITICEYRDLKQKVNFRLLDGKKINSRSVCGITNMNYFYENQSYGIFYGKNETLVVCISLRYFKLHEIGFAIIKKLRERTIVSSLTPEKYMERKVFIGIAKYGIKAEHNLACTPIRKDENSTFYKCTLKFSLVDLYARNSGASIDRIRFPKVKFYYKRIDEE